MERLHTDLHTFIESTTSHREVISFFCLYKHVSLLTDIRNKLTHIQAWFFALYSMHLTVLNSTPASLKLE